MEVSENKKDIFKGVNPFSPQQHISHSKYHSSTISNSVSTTTNNEIVNFNYINKSFKNHHLPSTSDNLNIYDYYSTDNSQNSNNNNNKLLGKRLREDDNDSYNNNISGYKDGESGSNSGIPENINNTTTTTTTTSISSSYNKKNNKVYINTSKERDEIQPNKKIKFSFQIENIKIQEAIDGFKKISFLELSKLHSEGLDNKSAVNKILDKIQSSLDKNSSPSNINKNSSSCNSDIDSIMKLGGYSLEEANRILKIKNEIVNLRKNGFDQASAVTELTRRLNSNNNTNTNLNCTYIKNNNNNNNCKSDIIYQFVNSNNVKYENVPSTSPHKRQHDDTTIDKEILTKRLKIDFDDEDEDEDNLSYLIE